jgi:signal transduction histidine kinase
MDEPTEMLSEIDATSDTVQAIIHTLRTICGELRPPILTQFGLEKAIRSHLGKVQETHPEIHISAELMDDNQRLSERARLALYRVYQNAISNVVRHAEAKHIGVEFQFDEKQIRLQIQDDGKGFVVPKKWVELVRSGHFGLAGIAERVEALGGQVNIKSAPGKGTTLQVDLPVN